jgi:hypothetical protein
VTTQQPLAVESVLLPQAQRPLSALQRPLPFRFVRQVSAIADVGAGRVLRQQCGGLLTVTAPHSGTAAFCIGELTLPTPRGHLFFYKAAIQLSLSTLRNAWAIRLLPARLAGVSVPLTGDYHRTNWTRFAFSISSIPTPAALAARQVPSKS